MFGLETLSDKELYEYYYRSKYNVTVIVNDSNVPSDHLDNNFKILNIKALKENQQLYSDLLRLAGRMGYKLYLLSEEHQDYLVIHMLILREFRRRKININDRDFNKNFYREMRAVPTYINDISPANYSGDKSTDFTMNFLFDYPVIKACKILRDKGYKTYWSSANRADINSRTGDVIAGKNVAYILIDPINLSDELKDRLRLDATEFWGMAEKPRNDDKYFYGIWAEITSEEMRIDELSELLAKEAIALPLLKNIKRL